MYSVIPVLCPPLMVFVAYVYGKRIMSVRREIPLSRIEMLREDYAHGRISLEGLEVLVARALRDELEGSEWVGYYS